MKPVLLIFPGHPENMSAIPFSVVVLASYLRKHDIPVKILDTRVRGCKEINYNDYCLIGISAKSGEQLAFAVELCKKIREKCNVPLVWGGAHASFFPEQTCRSDLVDFVIKGEGEQTLLELIRALDNNNGFEKIKGLIYKKKGIVVVNAEREFLDMDTLDIPAYDLININLYQDATQYFTIETSRGCPHRCSFCYVHDFHKMKWRYKSLTKVFYEIKYIMDKYNTKKFTICDDNFFVDKERVLDFCRGIINKNIKIEIFAYARANYFARYSFEELELIKDSGFKFIAIGAESGSQRVLDFIHKDITKEDILLSAKNCVKHGIIPVYSFIIGIPGEKKEDLEKTIDIYFKLKNISSKVEINGFYVFTPYPGTPIFRKSIEWGYKPFDSLEGWASWKFSDSSNLTWLNKSERFHLQVLSKLVQFFFIKERFDSYGKEYKRKKLGSLLNLILWNLGSPVLNLIAKTRFKNKFFKLGYEWILLGHIALNKFKAT